MLRALAEAGVRPDLVVGTSIGALNGVLVAADPAGAADRLSRMWQGEELRLAFSEKLWGRAVRLVRSGTHLHSLESLRRRAGRRAARAFFADLKLPFQCVAASIEGATRALVLVRACGAGGDGLMRRARAAAAGGDRRHPLLRRRPGRLDPGRAGGRARRYHRLRAAGGADREPAGGADAGRGRWAWSRSRSPGGTGSTRRCRRCRSTSGCTCCRPAGTGSPPGLAQFRYRDQARVGQSIERAYAASQGYLAALARN